LTGFFRPKRVFGFNKLNISLPAESRRLKKIDIILAYFSQDFCLSNSDRWALFVKSIAVPIKLELISFVLICWGHARAEALGGFIIT
jgi:hypothetical protein